MTFNGADFAVTEPAWRDLPGASDLHGLRRLAQIIECGTHPDHVDRRIADLIGKASRKLRQRNPAADVTGKVLPSLQALFAANP